MKVADAGMRNSCRSLIIDTLASNCTTAESACLLADANYIFSEPLSHFLTLRCLVIDSNFTNAMLTLGFCVEYRGRMGPSTAKE